MKIHKKLIFLVAIGMLLILAITVLSFRHIWSAYSQSTKRIGQVTAESRRIWIIERKIDQMSDDVRSYVMTGDKGFRKSYEDGLAEVNAILSSPTAQQGTAGSSEAFTSITSDFDPFREQARIILSMQSPTGRQKENAENMIAKLEALHVGIEGDMDRYYEENGGQMRSVLDDLRRQNLAINSIFLGMVATVIVFLFVFALYFHRKVSAPLQDLWAGAEEIRKGNLDYQVKVRGHGDIAQLGQRFNEMAQRVRASYGELEQKLYERTHELASLDAVALTLSQAGTLKDVLDKSLLRILDSLGGLQPKGGVFLCEPDGETMKLVSHSGLSEQFVERESVIRMGECLCGMVAQTGDLLFTDRNCRDHRHSRMLDEESHGHIIIPIKSRGIVLGVIFLYPEKDFELKPSDVQMLDAIGVQLGMAVENFRFYAEVKESSEKYWDLFENGTDILFTLDPSGRLTAVNKAAESFFGCSKVELVGMLLFDFLSPEDANRARELFDKGPEAGRRIEFEVVRRDGTKGFMEMSVRRLSGKQQPAGYQVSARDVTEQKRLRSMLLEAERLGAIGQVGVAVRHEVNNPLTTIIGNVELLLERHEGKNKDLTDRLEVILNNALRIAEIVKQLQVIKKDKVVEYLKGVKMTDLKQK